MPHIPPLPPSDATEEVKNLYEDFRRRMMFPSPPNFIMTQGHAAAVARGTWGVVSNVLVSGQIPRWTKEMIFAAISMDRNCQYCAAAHIACCRMLGVKPEILDALVRNLQSVSDAKLLDTINFALKCSKNPQSVTSADYDKLRRHGLTQAEILEVVAMAALAVYANILADATAMEADTVFDSL